VLRWDGRRGGQQHVLREMSLKRQVCPAPGPKPTSLIIMVIAGPKPTSLIIMVIEEKDRCCSVCSVQFNE
jgi:hypothetical protein